MPMITVASIAGVVPAILQAMPASPHSTQSGREKTAVRHDSVPELKQGAQTPLRILYFIDHLEGNSVFINGGTEKGILPGALLHTLRPVPGTGADEKTMVQTGTLKVVSLSETHAVAKIVREGMDLAKSSFSRHPGVMAGDFVRIPGYLVRPVKQVMPLWESRYSHLFRIPGPNPYTYELSEKGQDLLREVAGDFGGRHFSAIFVKAHTDAHGPSDQNQIESYQRALTVRQYLIEELGFEPSRITALGMGETDLKNKSRVHGAAQENRRIEISVVRVPE